MEPSPNPSDLDWGTPTTKGSFKPSSASLAEGQPGLGLRRSMAQWGNMGGQSLGSG